MIPILPAAADLVAQLVAIRKSKGIMQATVARRMHVTPPVVSVIENGHREPLVSTLIRYADAVGARITIDASNVDERAV